MIQFSEESRVYLMDNTLEVARAMIQAGIQAAAELSEGGAIVTDGSDGFEDAEGQESDTGEAAPRTLH